MLIQESSVQEQAHGYRWVKQACPTCELPPTQLLGRRGGAAHHARQGVECMVWRCGRCGLIFPNPMPVPLAGLEQHYGVEPDTYFVNHDLVAREASAELVIQRAAELNGGPGRLLDIGSGRGELLRVARQAGWTAVGIEPSASFAEYAARYSGAEVWQTPIEECEIEPGSFDVVIMAALLEHLYNPNETIFGVAGILRQGGLLYLDVPNEEGLYFQAANLYHRLRGRSWTVNLAPTFAPFHTFGFSPRSLQALLAKHDLRVEQMQVTAGVSLVPEAPGLVGRLERIAARIVTSASRLGTLGTYIAAWARKT
jgi:SAM-dependent methyltransferase